MPEPISASRHSFDEEQIFRSFGARLKQARQKARLTQAELAKRADLTRTYIIELEGGGANVSLKILAKMSALLDIGPRDFFPASAEDPISRVEVSDLLTALDRIPLVASELSKLLDELRRFEALRLALEQSHSSKHDGLSDEGVRHKPSLP